MTCDRSLCKKIAPKESSLKIAIFVRLNAFCMDESQNIEYKSIWKDEYYKWICGFANAIGGRIFLAVEFALKNGRITNTDVQEMAKVSKPTATRLLASLSDYLEVKGTTGKGTYYVVKGFTKGS